MIAIGYNGTFKVLNSITGAVIFTQTGTNPISSLDFSADSTYLALCSNSSNGQLQVYKTSNWAFVSYSGISGSTSLVKC
jgi:WD40 repeat protein